MASIHGNENFLYELIKNQTSIAETTVNILKKHDVSMKQQFNKIQDMASEINKLTEETDQYGQWLIATIHLFTAMNRYEDVQKSIVDVMLDAHHGRAGPEIISPRQLSEQMKIIRSNIDSNKFAPGENGQHALSEIYRIMTVQITTTEREIIFHLSIPLMQRDQ